MAYITDTSSFGKEDEKALPKPLKPLHPLCRSLVSFYHRHLHEPWRKINGYHFGVMCCACTSAFVLLTNLVATIWGVRAFGIQGGIGTIQDGNCSTTTKLGFWLHLIINGLSTLLLGASNYSMQCLSSPTRSEIDKAHRQGVWLDIGVPSVKNLRRISTSRIAFWWLLAISTIPLHLFYNSAVFSSLYSLEYHVWVVPVDFPDETAFSYYNGSQASQLYYQYQQFRANATLFQRLENRACLEAYSNSIVSDRGTVLLVSSHNATSVHASDNYIDSTLFFIKPGFNVHQDIYPGPDEWICGPTQQFCDVRSAASNVSSWVFEYWDVQYCLSQQVEEHCKLQFSTNIMIAVIVCNFVKLSCMAWIAWKQDSEPIITVGDAIASFLDRPDPTTSGNCLAGRQCFMNNKTSKWRTRSHLTRLITSRSRSESESGPEISRFWDKGPQIWEPCRRFWFSAASKERWILCNGLILATLSAVSYLLCLGLNNSSLANTSISYLYSLGFGTVNAQSIIASSIMESWGLLLTILTSNSPQIVLSFLYLGYNSLFTCMLVTEEWSGFAQQRKTLRVTSAKGKQRSTYWLQLPYRYSVPLLIASAALHWLISQSIFLARVTVLDDTGVEDPNESISTCGYSNIAIIFVIILGSVVVLVGLAHGFRKYQDGMPLAGCCSAAISAACHPPEEDNDASVKAVLWGVVDEAAGDDTGCAVGHCSFTSFEVTAPVEGQLYA